MWTIHKIRKFTDVSGDSEWPLDTRIDYVRVDTHRDTRLNAYYLEYDDKRSGGFAPLAKVSGDKKVVLGLVTTTTPELEDKEKVIARIHEAAKYVPLDRLYLKPTVRIRVMRDRK